MQYNSDGSLDPSFGVGGVVSTPVRVSAPRGGDESANTLAVQDDGKLVVAGSSGDGFALVRYNPDGSLDSSFGQEGTVVTTITPGARCCGSQAYAFFGTRGIVTTAITFGGDKARALALQKDGKLIVAGYSPNFGTGDSIALARYNSDGNLDTSFGTEGKVVTRVENVNMQAHAMALQADGKIVVAGEEQSKGQTRVFLARYNGDGSLDPGFGERGWVFTRIEIGTARISTLLLQSDGKLVIAGTRYEPSGSSSIMVVRYQADGSEDSSFGVSGA